MTDDQFTEQTVEATSDIMEFLSKRLDGAPTTEAPVLRASQAIALICASDMLLSAMPVEAAFEYRQAAKAFNRRLEEMWDAEDQT